MSTPKTPLFAALALVTACSDSRSEAQPDSLPHQSTVVAGQPAMTPGVCGYWETADSASRANCRKSLTSPDTRESNLIVASDCAYYETMSLDSLRACLTGMDSVARQCPVAHSWSVRQADGVAREAEWRRCGPQGGAFVGDSIVSPLHFLLLRRDSLPNSPLIFSYSNLAEPGAGGLDTVLAVDLDGDGADELFYIDQVYGTGAMFESCALSVAAGRLRCWSGPEFPSASAVLGRGELLYKGWIQVAGGPGEARETAGPMFATGRSIWYFTPVYRDGDANCCSTSGATIWVEARPRNGRFETGFVLRVREDSSQVVTGVDTLRR